MEPDELKKLILKELGAEELSSEEQDELITGIGENIITRTTLAILKNLSIEDQVEFERVVSEGDYMAGYNFASSKIENFQDFIKKEILEEIMEMEKEE